MEMLILSMLVATAVTRYGVTDLISTVRGTESPRHRERLQRMQLEHQRRMTKLQTRTGPTISEAIAARIAHRVAHPKPPKDRSGQHPFRAFWGSFWEDSWNHATDRRIRHHERKEAGHLPRQRAARKAREKARARWEQYERTQQARRAAKEEHMAEPPNGTTPGGGNEQAPPTVRATAERLDEDPPPVDEPQPEEPVNSPPDDPDPGQDTGAPDESAEEQPRVTQQPLATVHPITEGAIPMQSGEIYNPESALADATAIGAEMEQLVAHLDASHGALSQRNVTGAPLDAYAAMLEAAQSLVGAAASAATAFQNHIQIQDVVKSDDTVGDGEYLELEHAR